jgi:hypothetical protein
VAGGLARERVARVAASVCGPRAKATIGEFSGALLTARVPLLVGGGQVSRCFHDVFSAGFEVIALHRDGCLQDGVLTCLCADRFDISSVVATI